MRRRDLVAFAGTVLAWPLTARGQQPGRTYRIGVFSGQPGTAPHYVALFDELSRLGFIEGKNLEIDWSGFRLRPEEFDRHAAELVEARVDVILAGGGAAVRAAQRATAIIPIVAVTDDMVGEGLVASMPNPGGNTTGVSILATELDGKRQELLIELLPGARRIAALADSRATAPTALQALQEAARGRGIELVIHRIGTSAEIAPSIDTAKASGAAGLNVLASPVLFANGPLIFERAAALGLPAIYQWPEMVQQGGLAAYGPSSVQIYQRQISRFLAEVLRGKNPADLPVQQPTTFELVINMKAANTLGLTVPRALLARADEVIE